MANDVTFQSSTLATPAAGTVAETYDTGSGHRQRVAAGASSTKTFSDPAPTTSAAVVLSANALRTSCLIQNVGTVDVYLGKDNTVTTTNGIKLAAGASLADDASVDAWWGITASGTADLRVLETA